MLYDQYDNDSGVGIVAQNFEPSFDIYDSEQGDDFVVPSGQTWNIDQLDIAGVYFNGTGPAASINVVIYNDAGGSPGSVVANLPNLSYTDTSGGLGSYSIPLSGVSLTAGTYWVAVQPNMDFSSGGEWGWEGRTVQANSGGVWRNPGDGFGTGCTDWTNKETCIVAGEGPDQLFRLSGTTGGGSGYTTNTETGQSIVSGTTDVGVHCDDCTTTVSFPFPVQVYGDTYTSAVVSSNGNIQFTGNTPYLGASCLPDANLGRAFLPYQDDLHTGNSGEGIFSVVTGSAPDRIYYLEWRTHYFGRTGTANFEIALPESSTTLSVIYGATADDGVVEESGIQSSASGPTHAVLPPREHADLRPRR